MVVRTPNRTLCRNGIAPVDVLGFCGGRERPGICSGDTMMGSRNARPVASLAIVSALTVFLGGCETTGFNFGSSSAPAVSEPGVAPEMPATIRADEIVGRWGLASYQNPNDRAGAEKMARDQCQQPYVITDGGTCCLHIAVI